MAKGIIKTTWVAETSNYNKGCKEAKKALESFGSGLGVNVKALMSWQAGIASATVALGAFVKSNIETAKNFEKSMSSLSALTGMTGKDLDQLKQYAIELGGSTTETASQVADAFKIIGSAKPELLSSAEGLRDVTKAAITLGEAAGIEVPEAAAALTTSLNQMGEGADSASRFVNVLAAASQKGAGDINWLREAITNSGTAAKAVGASYEQLVANLEQLAQGGFDASSAGTALRSIIMSLEKQSNNEFKPSVVGLTEAFKNLGEAHLTISQYQNTVGKQFASQAMILANNAGKADELTTAITGTHIAEQQAETNTNNLEGALSRLSSAWEQFNLSINSSNGALKSFVDWLAEALGKINQWFSGNNFLNDALNDKGYKSYKDESSRSRQIASYNTGKRAYEEEIRKKQKEYDDYVAVTEKYYKNTRIGNAREEDYPKMRAELAALKAEYREYVAQGKDYFYPKTKNTATTTTGGGASGGTTSTTKNKNKNKVTTPAAQGSMDWYEQEISKLNKELTSATDQEVRVNIQNMIDEYTAAIAKIKSDVSLAQFSSRFDTAEVQAKNAEWLSQNGNAQIANKISPDYNPAFSTQLILKKSKSKPKEDKDDEKKEVSVMNASEQIVGGLSNISSDLQQLGVDIPEGIQKGISVLQTILSITSSIATIVTVIEALQAAKTVPIIGTLLAHGGVVHAANGWAGTVPGNYMSGDQVPSMLNSGETVLTRAMTNNLASQLNGTGVGNMNLTATIKGEDIRLALNNNSRRRGKGEYVTSRG